MSNHDENGDVKVYLDPRVIDTVFLPGLIENMMYTHYLGQHTFNPATCEGCRVKQRTIRNLYFAVFETTVMPEDIRTIIEEQVLRDGKLSETLNLHQGEN